LIYCVYCLGVFITNKGSLTLHEAIQRSRVPTSKKFSFDLKQRVVLCKNLLVGHTLQHWRATLST